MKLTSKQSKILNYKSLYSTFKNKISNEDSRVQLQYLSRKVKATEKIITKIANQENFTGEQLFISRIYILIFYLRILKIKPEAGVIATRDTINFIKEVCIHFNLSEIDTAEMLQAFEQFSEPVSKNAPLSIQAGHDAITSIFGKKKDDQEVE